MARIIVRELRRVVSLKQNKPMRGREREREREIAGTRATGGKHAVSRRR